MVVVGAWWWWGGGGGGGGGDVMCRSWDMSLHVLIGWSCLSLTVGRHVETVPCFWLFSLCFLSLFVFACVRACVRVRVRACVSVCTVSRLCSVLQI